MRLLVILLLLGCASWSAPAASDTDTGARILKAFRFFVDQNGKHTLSPSLLDRDAYQAQLRDNPDEVSGLRFDIQWRARLTPPTQITVRVELRHGAGNSIQTYTSSVVKEIKKKRRTHWSRINVEGKEYAALGELIAWRVSVRQGDVELAAEESFLW